MRGKKNVRQEGDGERRSRMRDKKEEGEGE